MKKYKLVKNNIQKGGTVNCDIIPKNGHMGRIEDNNKIQVTISKIGNYHMIYTSPTVLKIEHSVPADRKTIALNGTFAGEIYESYMPKYGVFYYNYFGYTHAFPYSNIMTRTYELNLCVYKGKFNMIGERDTKENETSTFIFNNGITLVSEWSRDTPSSSINTNIRFSNNTNGNFENQTLNSEQIQNIYKDGERISLGNPEKINLFLILLNEGSHIYNKETLKKELNVLKFTVPDDWDTNYI